MNFFTKLFDGPTRYLLVTTSNHGRDRDVEDFPSRDKLERAWRQRNVDNITYNLNDDGTAEMFIVHRHRALRLVF